MDYVSAVERLFAEAPDRFEELRRNLVTDGCFHGHLDSIKEQKRAASRALRAFDWFAQTGPRDAQPLPLSYDEREDLKRGGLPLQYIVAWFARSLAYRDYAFEGHPSLERYACGVLASPHAPDFIKNDASLAKDHPPCLLDGLGPGLVWTPGSAGIRNATPQRRRKFLQAPPPPATNSGQDLIKRAAANVPDWYAPGAPLPAAE
jgi:hypothetical protein